MGPRSQRRRLRDDVSKIGTSYKDEYPNWNYAADWLRHHIQGSDRKFVQFTRQG